MPMYDVRVAIASATGERVYRVKAASVEEAIRVAPTGDWECVHEEYNADVLDWEFVTPEDVEPVRG